MVFRLVVMRVGDFRLSNSTVVLSLQPRRYPRVVLSALSMPDGVWWYIPVPAEMQAWDKVCGTVLGREKGCWGLVKLSVGQFGFIILHFVWKEAKTG